MGPHSFECGNYRTPPSLVLIAEASMGPHSFECGNAVPPDGGSTRTFPVQWGRTRSSAEMGRNWPDYWAPTEASMGPHSFECGNGMRAIYAAGSSEGFNGAALVRVRKSPSKSALSNFGVELQWGRTRSSAEILLGFGDNHRRQRWLQWGRTRSSAEIWRFGPQ